MILTAVTLVMMVMMLHRVVKGMLVPSTFVLEIEIVLVVEILLVLHQLRFHVSHRFWKQSGKIIFRLTDRVARLQTELLVRSRSTH